jgi:hypothetical protein
LNIYWKQTEELSVCLWIPARKQKVSDIKRVKKLPTRQGFEQMLADNLRGIAARLLSPGSHFPLYSIATNPFHRSPRYPSPIPTFGALPSASLSTLNLLPILFCH